MRPPASERRADGQLALPGPAAREEHAGDIGAGDEQHHDHRAEQRLEDGLKGPTRSSSSGAARMVMVAIAHPVCPLKLIRD